MTGFVVQSNIYDQQWWPIQWHPMTTVEETTQNDEEYHISYIFW